MCHQQHLDRYLKNLIERLIAVALRWFSVLSLLKIQGWILRWITNESNFMPVTICAASQHYHTLEHHSECSEIQVTRTRFLASVVRGTDSAAWEHLGSDCMMVHCATASLIKSRSSTFLYQRNNKNTIWHHSSEITHLQPNALFC